MTLKRIFKIFLSEWIHVKNTHTVHVSKRAALK